MTTATDLPSHFDIFLKIGINLFILLCCDYPSKALVDFIRLPTVFLFSSWLYCFVYKLCLLYVFIPLLLDD